MKQILLAILAMAAFSSHAYIPEFSLIASRTADQHGRGSYLVEQEVTFHHESESYTVKETWLVYNENYMRLTLEGRGPLKGMISGTILYENGQRYTLDGGTSAHAQKLGEEWWEPLFYFRFSKFLRQRLIALKVVPPESLQDRPPMNSDGELNYQPPEYIRLSRVGGVTNWAIGVPPVGSNAPLRPTLWIEQDQFTIRKLRGTQSLLKADDYFKSEDNFWFPRTRAYTFGATTVEVQTLGVRSLGKAKTFDPRFKPASLVSGRDTLKLPDADAVREFYARFR